MRTLKVLLGSSSLWLLLGLTAPRVTAQCGLPVYRPRPAYGGCRVYTYVYRYRVCPPPPCPWVRPRYRRPVCPPYGYRYRYWHPRYPIRSRVGIVLSFGF